MISMDKKYQTKSGQSVRILCVDRAGTFPVVALVGDQKYVITYTQHGNRYSDMMDRDYDLVEVPQEYFRTLSFTPDMSSTQDMGQTSYPRVKLGAYVAGSAADLRAQLEGSTAYKYIAVLNEHGLIIRIEEF